MKAIVKKIKSYIGINFFDTVYKTLVFKDLLICLFPKYLKIKADRSEKKRKIILSSVKTRSVIKVAFLLQTSSVWKYDRLYWLLEKHPRFEPTVVVSPFNVHINYDSKEIINVMTEALSFVKSKGYRFYETYDITTNKWIDLRKTINPDIVFFTKPYKDTLPKYHIYYFLDKLCYYTSYGVPCTTRNRENFSLPFFSFLSTYFIETTFHKDLAVQYSVVKGRNTVVTSCLSMEHMMMKNYEAKDVWKKQKRLKKRIIWAPHHTVDYLFNFSNFLVYAESMKNIAEKYEDKIQIAFKPHPVLKFKLINIWGREKTEEYYEYWRSRENTQLEEGYYVDLFLTSDAMIHDCVSFMAEYLHIPQKPVLFMVRNEDMRNELNVFGQRVFELHHKAYILEDIESFIENVVLQGVDELKVARESFFEEYLFPKDGIMPSQKILSVLEKHVT